MKQSLTNLTSLIDDYVTKLRGQKIELKHIKKIVIWFEVINGLMAHHTDIFNHYVSNTQVIITGLEDYLKKYKHSNLDGEVLNYLNSTIYLVKREINGYEPFERDNNDN